MKSNIIISPEFQVFSSYRQKEKKDFQFYNINTDFFYIQISLYGNLFKNVFSLFIPQLPCKGDILHC